MDLSISLGQIAFLYLLVVAFGIFAYTCSQLTLVLVQGRKPQRSYPLHELPARLVDVVLYFFMQKSVLRKKLSYHHALIFWGFMVITLASIEIFINGVFPNFITA